MKRPPQYPLLAACAALGGGMVLILWGVAQPCAVTAFLLTLGYCGHSPCAGVAPAFLVGDSPPLAGVTGHCHRPTTSTPTSHLHLTSSIPCSSCSAPTTTRTTCCTSDRCGCSPRPSSAACSVTALRRRRCASPPSMRPARRPLNRPPASLSLITPVHAQVPSPPAPSLCPRTIALAAGAHAIARASRRALPDGVHDVKRDAFACGEDDPGPMVPGRAWMAIALTVGVVWTLADARRLDALRAHPRRRRLGSLPR